MKRIEVGDTVKVKKEFYNEEESYITPEYDQIHLEGETLTVKKVKFVRSNDIINEYTPLFEVKENDFTWCRTWLISNQ